MDESVQKHLTELDEASRLLLKAADWIERDGWWGCGGSRGNGGHCMALAIARAKETPRLNADDPIVSEALDRVKDALGATSIFGVFQWNDDPKRKAVEVVARLRSVALSGS